MILQETRLLLFLKQHDAQLKTLQNEFILLFNNCGKKYNDSSIQLALTGAIIAIFLKNTNIEKKEIEKMLENLKEKFK